MKILPAALRTLALLALLPIFACAPRPTLAEADLKPTRGNSATGQMSFAQLGRDIVIKGEFTGLTPGPHGLHIHQYGDCSGPGAAHAGGHFNPFRKRHGPPGGPASHLGDLPMLTAGKDGRARFEARMVGLSLDDGQASILGRSVVVSARPDNFTTQPDGNSGPGVACGVIELK
jgi:Cu-Zn family superoxide dismutase